MKEPTNSNEKWVWHSENGSGLIKLGTRNFTLDPPLDSTVVLAHYPPQTSLDIKVISIIALKID